MNLTKSNSEINLDLLTEEQKNFVLYKGNKSIIVSSTAGSGKSFCCVERLKFLLNEGVDPKKIIFFSFTNAAVEELKRRVNNSDIRITTIHSFSLWMLHRMGKSKQITSFVEFLDWYKKENEIKFDIETKEFLEFEKKMSNLYDDADYLESQITSYKLQKAENILVEEPYFYKEYSNYLEDNKKTDFSDILLDVRESLKENKWLKMFKDKYDYLFLDEYQDTSSIQMDILMKLNAKRYYLVGDSNQSIYSYSGSNCKVIEETLEKRRKVERMSLTVNFRSAKEIVENSNKFSTLNASFHHQFKGNIEEKFVDFNQLIKLIKSDDEVVILCRSNFVVKLIEVNLLKNKIPMRYFNYLKEKDIQDIKKNKISPLIRERIDYVLKYFNGDIDELIKFIEDNRENENFVTTIHKSKGKEFDTCVVVNSLSQNLIEKNNKPIPEHKKDYYTFYPEMDNYQEEKNVHYVAISRPKRNLYYMLLEF